MKLLTLLLSLIILTLNSVPCCGFESSGANHIVQENSHGKDDCSEVCSPFYTCGACVGFTIGTYFGEILADCLKSIQHHSIYLSFEPSRMVSPIWQPPKFN